DPHGGEPLGLRAGAGVGPAVDARREIEAATGQIGLRGRGDLELADARHAGRVDAALGQPGDDVGRREVGGVVDDLVLGPDARSYEPGRGVQSGRLAVERPADVV